MIAVKDWFVIKDRRGVTDVAYLVEIKGSLADVAITAVRINAGITNAHFHISYTQSRASFIFIFDL